MTRVTVRAENDQIDLDWVFDRQLLDLTIDGKPRRVVVTAGIRRGRSSSILP